jgi:alkylation response protein AidB-like acyl-CoA dehydrogenase
LVDWLDRFRYEQPMRIAKTELSRQLSDRAGHYDLTQAWPIESMQMLAASEVWAADIPPDFGGLGYSKLEQTRLYHQLGRGDMSVTLLMSQRFAAARWLLRCQDENLRRRLFSQMLDPEHFVTIGVCHLTTSSSGGVIAQDQGDSYLIDGVAPWVSGAQYATAMVVAAALDNGDNILCWLDTHSSGVNIEPPIQTAGLSQAFTSAVKLESVSISKEMIMRQPTSQPVADSSKSPFVPAMGLGLAASCLDVVSEELYKNTMYKSAYNAFASEHDQLFAKLEKIATGEEGLLDQLGEIRAQINILLMRLSAFMMLALKGKGYAVGSVSERLAREAMFFCVWSIPKSIRLASLNHLLHKTTE